MDMLGENCCWSLLGLKGLIIKESGDGGSDGKGRTNTLRSRFMLSPPIINPLVLLACLQLSQIVCSPLSLGRSIIFPLFFCKIIEIEHLALRVPMLDAMSAKSARVAEGGLVGGKKNRGTVITEAHVGTFGFAGGGGVDIEVFKLVGTSQCTAVPRTCSTCLIKNKNKHNKKKLS